MEIKASERNEAALYTDSGHIIVEGTWEHCGVVASEISLEFNGNPASGDRGPAYLHGRQLAELHLLLGAAGNHEKAAERLKELLDSAEWLEKNRSNAEVGAAIMIELDMCEQPLPVVLGEVRELKLRSDAYKKHQRLGGVSQHAGPSASCDARPFQTPMDKAVGREG